MKEGVNSFAFVSLVAAMFSCKNTEYKKPVLLGKIRLTNIRLAGKKNTLFLVSYPPPQVTIWR